MDELEWYEKDLDEFDHPQTIDEREIIQPKKKIPHLKREISSHADEKDYPFDLWYVIGTYIAPEDIGRFALICQATNRVVNTIAFWIAIFRRYNKFEARRFSRLLMKEHFSIIRTYVIKSLYENYSPFQIRLNRTDAIQKDPHFLLTSRCIRIWYSKRSSQRQLYNYYFEFRSSDTEQETPIHAQSSIFRKNTEYIIDRDSWILHLICSNFIPIGPYMGMILSKLTLNVSSDYRYHKLKMWFNSSKLSKCSNSMVTIDPVLCLRIYKWFNIPAKLD